KNIFNYINKESPKNAKKFNQTLKEQMSKIEAHPASFPLIDYENFDNSNNEYRFSHFFKSFKIIFKLPKDLLIFLGIIHDRQDTENIKDLKSE
ncbi:MAG: type II toxin-antitoxin system RelE/ParE family toxin, partial [Leptospiraceae bacterium]|nr:type II toxin-antitoxin system RelE/ParE family toxin [Leptospiraceae bacterium]